MPSDDSSAATSTRRPLGDRRALERMLAFSDAVVAIAMTLVALPLVDRAMEAPDSRAFFADNTISIASAALTFLIVSVFWRYHHRLFSDARGYSGAVLNLELAWLAAILFLPVATVLDFASPGTERLTIGVYIGTLFVISLLLRVQAVMLERAGAMDPTGSGFAARWIGALLFGLALALALLFPSVGAWWLLVLLAENAIQRLIDARRNEREGADPTSMPDPHTP